MTLVKQKKVRVKRKSRKKIIVFFLVFELFFTAVTGPLILLYGPFNNIKKLFIGTAMSSFKHQYIAKIFLSDSKINEILNGNEAETGTATQNTPTDGTINVSEINVPKVKSDEIERYEINNSKFKCFLLIVHDPTKVNVGMTKYLGKVGQKTSEIANDNDAVAAINGGGFTDKSSDGKYWTGTGGLPTGLVIHNGEVLYNDLQDTAVNDFIGINKEGALIIGKYTAKELLSMKLKEVVTFGPTLVLNGVSQIKGDGGQGITARTAIGQRKDGAIILAVFDGRKLNMPGATLKDVANIMVENGAFNASNLDGGSSTTMYYEGDVINNPCNSFGERSIATALYVLP